MITLAMRTVDVHANTGQVSAMIAVDIELVPCLSDNYCVLLHHQATGETAAIDAPDSKPIIEALKKRDWRLTHIYTTHHHNDHTAGNAELKAHYGCQITGPAAEADRIPQISETVEEGSQLSFAGMEIRVLSTPGHTLGHVSYYLPELKTAFTGDTLFALGCGRIFEGDAEMMHRSLQKIAALPEETVVYCGHEYTASNAKFALTIEPENELLQTLAKEIEQLRSVGKPTLPTTIGLEKASNPFLRANAANIKARLGLSFRPDAVVFARIRQLKDKA